jgi:hypothetical protein
VDEKKIDAHLDVKEHHANKKRILDTKTNKDENSKSVIQIWLDSF